MQTRDQCKKKTHKNHSSCVCVLPQVGSVCGPVLRGPPGGGVLPPGSGPGPRGSVT